MSHGTVQKAQPAVRVLEYQRKKEKNRVKGNDSFHLDSKEICALIEILARLLQTDVDLVQGDPGTQSDFWLYVTMFVLDEEARAQHCLLMSELKSGHILHDGDIGAYGNGMT